MGWQRLRSEEPQRGRKTDLLREAQVAEAPAAQFERVRGEDAWTAESRKRPPPRSAPKPGGGIGPLIAMCYIKLG